MRLDLITKQIICIAKNNPNGFTFNPKCHQFPTKGYAVASDATQACFGKNGLFKVVKFYMKHMDHCIGGWCNEDGVMQFDASKVYLNIEDAVRAAIANGQRAFYNLYTGREIKACEYPYYLTNMAA